MFKAISYAIFTGSNYLGAEMIGKFEQDTILENTEGCLEGNSQHLKLNRPDLKILKPSEWDTPEYISKLKEEKYDYFYSNPPCSGLSAGSLAAHTESKMNDYLKRAFRLIDELRPKVFFIENAPTLLSKIGWPIIQEATCLLQNNYNLLFAKDAAMFHNVPMCRKRTLFLGFSKQRFGTTNFTLFPEDVRTKNVLDLLPTECEKYPFDAKPDVTAHQQLYDFIEKNREMVDEIFEKEKSVKRDSTISMFAKYSNEYEWKRLLKDDKYNLLRTAFERVVEKLSQRKAYFDAGYPISIFKNTPRAPSMTSYIRLYNVEERRPFYLREYAAIMGYPTDFKFTDKGSVAHMAQGVPVNFANYVHRNVVSILEGTHDSFGKKARIILQTNNGLKQEHFIASLPDILELADITEAIKSTKNSKFEQSVMDI
ncbi:MAG TPA: DNA cytosine methyltransferase [Saccharofermentans sp.]|nr:DNA cytosine methyltransferase [Saccharofermentans sp.]